MAITRSVILTLAFQDATDRKFKFNGVDADKIDAVKIKVITLNQNMPQSFKTTFVSDTGAECVMISAAQAVQTEEEVIYHAS